MSGSMVLGQRCSCIRSDNDRPIVLGQVRRRWLEQGGGGWHPCGTGQMKFGTYVLGMTPVLGWKEGSVIKEHILLGPSGPRAKVK